MPLPSGFVSTEWLADHLGDPDLRIVDATFHMAIAKRDADAEYLASHIPGAVRFDVDAIRDRVNPLPHMIPSPADFASAMAGLGIGDGTKVVAYDTYGLSSAARAWWMLRLYGHDAVAVLDGGLPKWLAEGRPVESGVVAVPAAAFTPQFRRSLVLEQSEVAAALAAGSLQVVDARAKGRFEGTEPEPRAGLRGGHIPGTRSVPFADLVDPATKTMIDAAAIEARFRAAGVDLGRPVAASCGSGVTACVLALALHQTGRPDIPVYDGSWSEWGGRPDLPVATGPA
jgi:thiosulfate/3-mercaptopyruvate sulfurtransferase